MLRRDVTGRAIPAQVKDKRASKRQTILDFYFNVEINSIEHATNTLIIISTMWCDSMRHAVLRRDGTRHPYTTLHAMASIVIVWYGMVWYGVVWCGMVWYGMVWYNIV